MIARLSSPSSRLARAGRQVCLLERGKKLARELDSLALGPYRGAVLNTQTTVPCRTTTGTAAPHSTGTGCASGAANACFLPVPGYGHIDCMFGKRAALDVYPLILEHLEATR